MTEIKNVIFDLDGTLVDTEVLYLGNLTELAEELGIEISDKELFCYAGKNLIQKLELVKRLHCEVTQSVEELVAVYRKIQKTRDNVSFAEYIFPDTISSLDRLKSAGLRLYLCTNSGIELVSSILAQCGMTGYFEEIMTRDMAGARKPDPKVYTMLLDKAGLSPDCTVAVEDSDTGIQSARGAGLEVLCVRDSRFGFSLEGAYRIFSCLTETVDYILEGHHV